jgi:Protein of unknown function (DUF3987)/Bifunctional DNA primase/polymerase, N-terminal
MTTPLEIATGYLARGWNPLPVRYRQKVPIGSGWQNRIITADNIGEHFNGGKLNIGVQLGPNSHGLTDIDLDCDEAIQLARALLPKTPAYFGRHGKPPSHFLFTIDDAPERATLAIPDKTGKDGQTIIELRLGGGPKGAQTVFPGSTHESGEVIEWAHEGTPARSDYATLKLAVTKIAVGIILRRAWPARSGHFTALALGGFLARVGWSDKEIEKFVHAVAPDPKWKADSARTARNSAEALARGEPVQGLPELRNWIGDEAVKRLAQLLDYDPGGMPDPDDLYEMLHGDTEGAADPDSRPHDSKDDRHAGASGDPHSASNTEWPEPVDLWGSFEPPMLPKGILPSLIENFAFTEGENMVCDPAGLALAALTVAASVIPDTIQLRMKPKTNAWKESARLWTMLVADVSGKKTPILNRATWPIKLIDSQLYREYAAELEAFEIALETYERQKKSKDQPAPQPPEKPKQRRARLEDTTIEAAQEVFAASPDGLLMLQDELSSFFGSMDRYSGGGKDRGFWLQSFNGGEYIVNRIKRGANYIQNLSASLLGGIQPERIREISDGLVDDGLLQRCIPIIMRKATASRDETSDRANIEYGNLIERLYNIWLPDEYLVFDPAAQAIRREMEDKHLMLADCEVVHKKFGFHIGKYDGIFGRLCVVFHCIENMSYRDFNHTITAPIISGQTAQRVADFMQGFLFPHAFCFYGGVLGLSDEHENISKVAGYILANKLERIDSRTLQQGIRDMRGLKKQDTEDLFDQLHAFGWIIKGTNRQRNSFGLVNPKVHKLFEAQGKAAAERAKAGREAIAAALELGKNPR